MVRKSALSKEPSKPRTGGGLTQNLQRLSPGVYRNAGGQLTNQGGRPLPQQPNRQQSPMEWQLQAPSSMAPMQRPTGPLRDPGFFSNEGVGQLGMVNLPAQYAPGQNVQDVLSGIAGQGNVDPGQTQNGIYWASGFGPNAAQMPQPSANKGGKYRLSPGVYGTREQAMQQYNQQLQGMAVQGANQAMPNQVGQGPGNFIGQQRERELGYAENRFNAAKNNNLLRGNPIKRFKF